jgi:hypothetical protein
VNLRRRRPRSVVRERCTLRASVSVDGSPIPKQHHPAATGGGELIDLSRLEEGQTVDSFEDRAAAVRDIDDDSSLSERCSTVRDGAAALPPPELELPPPPKREACLKSYIVHPLPADVIKGNSKSRSLSATRVPAGSHEPSKGTANKIVAIESLISSSTPSS